MRIEGTKNTPEIYIDKGIFEMSGRSIPEDAQNFFSSIQDDISMFMENIIPGTKIIFNLEYINSGSKKYLCNLIGEFNKLLARKEDVRIYWYYDSDDESMLEIGNDFRSISSLPFHILVL